MYIKVQRRPHIEDGATKLAVAIDRLQTAFSVIQKARNEIECTGFSINRSSVSWEKETADLEPSFESMEHIDQLYERLSFDIEECTPNLQALFLTVAHTPEYIAQYTMFMQVMRSAMLNKAIEMVERSLIWNLARVPSAQATLFQQVLGDHLKDLGNMANEDAWMWAKRRSSQLKLQPKLLELAAPR